MITPSFSLSLELIIEYINRAGRFHKQASAIFKALNEGSCAEPVLAEILYVAFRIYSSMGLPDPVKRAEKLQLDR
jgi:hypothetical protein